MTGICSSRLCELLVLCAIPADAQQNSSTASVASADRYPSLQLAIDANPGRVIQVPAGDYWIGQPLRIKTDGTGLCGFGRIIQTNPAASIVEIRQATNVLLRDLMLMRPSAQADTTEHAVRASDSEEVDLDRLQVLDNRSQAGTLFLERCRNSRVQNCTVKNYKRFGIDDRTGSELYGYAFRAIDGTGILVTESEGIAVRNNFVVEQNIYPTQETKERHQLGQFTAGRQPTRKGKLAPRGDYANNWHQGSAITVTSPEKTRHVQVIGNYIENAAQGIDLHADQVICSQNVINHAFIGIKCMHGSRNVVISNNNVSHMDLWGLIMMPGTLAHPAEAAANNQPPRGANFTRGNIIANNVFSDFGFGYEYYNWTNRRGGVISMESGQLPENPVMGDVLIQGNIVYDAGRDQVLEAGKPVTVEPRYHYAVFISPEPKPQGLRFFDNIFHPGKGGVCNLEWEGLR